MTERDRMSVWIKNGYFGVTTPREFTGIGAGGDNPIVFIASGADGILCGIQV